MLKKIKEVVTRARLLALCLSEESIMKDVIEKSDEICSKDEVDFNIPENVKTSKRVMKSKPISLFHKFYFDAFDPMKTVNSYRRYLFIRGINSFKRGFMISTLFKKEKMNAK